MPSQARSGDMPRLSRDPVVPSDAVLASPRVPLGLILAALTAALASCVTSAEAEEGAPDLVPMAAPTTPTTVASTTTTSLAATTTLAPPANDCVAGAIGEADESSGKGCSVFGIAVLGSAAVSNEAIEAAADHVFGMLSPRPDLAEALVDAAIPVIVIGASERITDLPAFADLYRLYPGTDWRRRGRSFPGTPDVPAAAAAEENLLCLEDDRFAGQNLFVRDFARTIRRFALAEVDRATYRDIDQAFNRAIQEGLWRDTLAETNVEQYWAEVSQSYFDVNGYPEEDDEPSAVRTRDELRRYDPNGYAAALAVYGDTTWRPPCR